MTRRLIVLALASMALAGMSAAASAADLVKVRYGVLAPPVSGLHLYLGKAKGIYARHGVDLDIVEFLKGGPELTAAAASGQIDMGDAGTPILTGISRGLPIRVVGSPPRKGQPFVLVGRPDVQTLAQLKGATVGFGSVGGGGAQALRYILTANDIDPRLVKTTAFGGNANGYASLKSGQTSAVIISEPFVTKAEQDGIGHVLADAEKYFGRYQHSYIFASQTLIASRPDTIKGFFAASKESLDYARQHPDELIALAEKRLKFDTAFLKTYFDRELPRWDATGAIDQEGLLNAVKVVRELGDISKSYEPDINKIADLRFAAP